MGVVIVLVNAELGSEEFVKGEIEKIGDAIKEVHRVYMVYNLLVKIEVKTRSQANEIINYKIRNIRCKTERVVHSTTTLVERSLIDSNQK